MVVVGLFRVVPTWTTCPLLVTAYRRSALGWVAAT
jgi:hypothetical protein